MFKRIISVIIIVFMLISVLTGCNVNELGYISLFGEANTLNQYEIKGYFQSETPGGLDKNIEIEFSGEVNQEDLGSIYVNVDVMMKSFGKGNKSPIKIIIEDNNIYVSKNIVTEILNLGEELGGPVNKQVIEELTKAVDDKDYIMSYTIPDIYEEEIAKLKDYTRLFDAARISSYPEFENFESEFATKIHNGYAIEFTHENMREFIEEFIEYIMNNKEQIFDEIIKNIKEAGEAAETKESNEIKRLALEIEEKREDCYNHIREAVLQTQINIHKSYLYRKNTYKHEVYKKGETYIQTLEINNVYDDSVTSIQKITLEKTPKTVKKIFVENSILLDEVEAVYNDLENKYNPVKEIEISWRNFNDLYIPNKKEAKISTIRENGSKSNSNQPYSIIEDRIYLPLRYISEAFGEEVQWDDSSKKAYIVRNNQRIDMTGELIDSKTMIKVRDFEKLGYKVDFMQEDNLSTAIIKKNQ